MRLSCVGLPLVRRYRSILIASVASLCLIWLSLPYQQDAEPVQISAVDLERNYPLAWKLVHMGCQKGGAWYIPPSWRSDAKEPTTITEAAQYAFSAANSSISRQIPHSRIPLMIHQTWKNCEIDTWSKMQRDCVEKWLGAAANTSNNSEGMAYFLWDDNGMRQHLESHDMKALELFDALPVPVEKTDLFRIVVAKSMGGIYADIDTAPLRTPAGWVSASDLDPWTDDNTGTTHGLPLRPTDQTLPRTQQPVRLILGIEADNDPKTDNYWRMGYSYPLQLTQWSFASAPDHPILSGIVDQLARTLKEHIGYHKAGSPEALKEIRRIDPVTLTGPAAVTNATKQWLEDTVEGFRWDSLTGLLDGGRSKLAGDVLVLPITAFSPGRGKYGNMGSKPFTHPDARVRHHGQNSWRKFDQKVEWGKFCRTVFGLCKDWSKVPSN